MIPCSVGIYPPSFILFSVGAGETTKIGVRREVVELADAEAEGEVVGEGGEQAGEEERHRGGEISLPS